MPPALTDDKRTSINNRIEIGEDTARIAYLEGVTARQVRKIRRNLAIYASVVAPQYRRGPARLIGEVMKDSLLEYIDLHPTVYLDEMCLYLYDEYGITVSTWTVARMLRREGWTHKKVSILTSSAIAY
jgi:transposase